MATRIACARIITLEDVELVGNCKIAGIDSSIIEEALDAGSDGLARLAVGWTLGRCTVALRPCREACMGRPCGCCQTRGVRLSGVDPEVTEVLIDGEAVDADTYALITQPNGDVWLERFKLTGERDYWPNCQRVDLAATEENTFQITYEHGLAIDIVMRLAAAEIAWDLLSPLVATRNSMEDLPDGTQSVNGYGMNISMVRDVAGFEGVEVDRLSGLGFVKRFLALYPPQTGNATMWAPEISDGRSHFVRG